MNTLRSRRKAAFYNTVKPRCAICAEDMPLLIDFHHVGAKDEKISRLLRNAIDSPHRHSERLCNELKRTVPLCVTCHRLLHAGVVMLPANTKIGIDVNNLLDILKGA
jgi:hypothetical protein